MSAPLRPLATLFALHACLVGTTQAGEGAPVTARVRLLERGEGADLVCPQAGPAPRPPAQPSSAQPRPTPTPPQAREIPDADETRELLRQLARPEIRQAAGLLESSPPRPLPPGSLFAPPPGGQPLRVAIWGDSHLAAGFFTEEIVRQLQLSPAQVESSWIPAQMNRPGVRLPVRKTCVGPGWRHEAAYVRPDAASAPAPGLVNLVADTPGALLAWDLRPPNAAARPGTLQLLYQQTEAPIQISLQLDGGPEQAITLRGQPGPARLEIGADGPIRSLHLRLQEGQLRVHGLALPPNPDARLHLDVFGFPGATVAGWKNADPAYLARWFADQPPYQLVMLEFGTNEGNLKPFDPQAYRQTLSLALRRLRTLFPDAACVLIAPGDRGVLLPRRPKATAPAPQANGLTERQQEMLTYTRIHQHIGQIQQDVARDYQCRTWSALDALGGPGSAYRDVHATPPLMARDLIHFTVAGYQAWGRAVVGWGR
jgi:lysophospholipase L1-like esterase